MEQERVREHLAEHPGLIGIRSEENKQELKENAGRAREQVGLMLSENTQLREQLKQYQVEQSKEVLGQLGQERSVFKESWAKFQESREGIKSKMGQKLVKEKELQDILRVELPTISITDFEKLIVECAGVQDFNEKLLVTARKLLKNLRIHQLSEKFTEALSVFNVEALNAGMEEYQKYAVTGIEEELIGKVQEMINEAKDNPNFTADKQAELKKAGKKGKK